MQVVKIHYHRPPNRTTIFENELVYANDDVVVTIMRATPLPRPMIVNGKTVFEDGAPAVWFTFPDTDYDVGRFHTRDGTFTGIYANILTPVQFVSTTEWRTTDLFVDVWVDADGSAHILDEDELAEAVTRGWIEHEAAEQVRRTAHKLVTDYKRGTWPPQVVYDWPLERVRTMFAISDWPV
jgi:predicted RNA-binding protein associated with RNAse of E/G family